MWGRGCILQLREPGEAVPGEPQLPSPSASCTAAQRQKEAQRQEDKQRPGTYPQGDPQARAPTRLILAGSFRSPLRWSSISKG